MIVDLHYESFGEGEPLLWVHGFMGAGADWRYIFEAPPAGFRLIAPDLRGHGSTANLSGVFSFRDAAADVLALLHQLKLTRVKAIGVSGGGITLLHMATNPLLILGVGIFAVSTLLWLLALMKADLSFAYPFLSLTYIAVLIGSAVLFNENVTLGRVLGFAVIVTGVWIVARSESKKVE